MIRPAAEVARKLRELEHDERTAVIEADRAEVRRQALLDGAAQERARWREAVIEDRYWLGVMGPKLCALMAEPPAKESTNGR